MKRKYQTAEEYLRDWPCGVSGGKGGDEAKAQYKRENDLTDKALANQMAHQKVIDDAFTKYLGPEGEGYSKEQLALLKSQFLNQQSQGFNDAGRNVRSALAARGMGTGAGPEGGDYVRNLSGLEGLKASTTASGLRDITLSDIQQNLKNRFMAGNMIAGNAVIDAGNTSNFNSNSEAALNSYITAANSGFGAAFMKSLGGSLGAGIGGIATGGMGGLISGGLKGARAGAGNG